VLKRFRNYIETGNWERYLEEDHAALTMFSWAVILLSLFWFGPTVIRILVWGPPQ